MFWNKNENLNKENNKREKIFEYSQFKNIIYLKNELSNNGQKSNCKL